jgi:hypothetical protein
MLLTNPIWLLALAAISIPVIIHLWNIKPGKTLKVGSISLFTESSPSSSRSFKLLDILLLLLRCLLLTLLALLLAVPLLQQHLKTSKAKGWILIPYADFNQAYRKFQPKIDSLAKTGYEVHFFRPDFLKQDLNELVNNKTLPDSTQKKDSLNYWALINQLTDRVSSATPVELFTPNTITHFRGEKPVTSLHINWHTYTPADSVNNWLAGAWLTDNGSIRVMQGTSTPSGTTYQYNDVKNGGQNSSAYSVAIDKGLPFVNLQDTKIPVDTAIPHIAIYTDKAEVDASYLKAALQAIAQLTGRNMVIKLYNHADAIPVNQDWIYWLSEKPVDTTLSAKTKNLFSYEAGKITEVNSWISNNESHTITQRQIKIALYKTIITKITNGRPIWTDGFGNPILSAGQKGRSIQYHFYSRFNPTWNELVWDDEFPKWLLTLTQPIVNDAMAHDHRVISNAQLQPDFIADAKKAPTQLNTYTDLTHYLWLALALALFTERWLATKNKTILANG